MKEGRTFPQVEIDTINKLSIKLSQPLNQEKVIKLVDKIRLLNNNLNESSEKQTSKKDKIKIEIMGIDRELDEEVYKIYEITDKEKETIKKSFGIL